MKNIYLKHAYIFRQQLLIVRTRDEPEFIILRLTFKNSFLYFVPIYNNDQVTFLITKSLKNKIKQMSYNEN